MAKDKDDKDPTQARSRIADIAEAAGVSTATVDRVLNGRSNVRVATAQRVLKAAARLQYLPEADLWRSLQPPPMDIAFLLPAGTNRYLHMLGDTIGYAAEALAPFNVRCRVHYIDSFDPEGVAAALRQQGKRAQGVAFMALEHPLVRAAVDALVARGVHVITLISDLSDSRRAAYVGMNNRAAGRTAGLLMGRFIGPRTGPVAMLAASLLYRGHEDRELGFLHLMQEQFPALQLVGVREGRDDAQTNYRQVRSLLQQYPNLVGLYNMGGGAEGVGRALKDMKTAQPVVVVAHGLTPDTRALLNDGTFDAVINQHPQTMVFNCVRIFSNLRDGHGATAGVEPIRISIVLRENLP